MNNRVDWLRDSSVYDLITDAKHEWARYLTRTVYERGRIVFQPEDGGDCLYLVVEGYVRTYRLSPEGREVTVGLHGPRDIFGELAVISQEPQRCFAEVLEQATVYLLPQGVLQEIIAREPKVAYNLMVRMSARLHRAEDLIEDLVSRDVASRVARTLLQLGSSFGRQSRGNTVIDLRLPYQEIANMVGSTRETVTRAISQMQQNRWVRLESGRLHLLDSEALQLLSE